MDTLQVERKLRALVEKSTAAAMWNPHYAIQL